MQVAREKNIRPASRDHGHNFLGAPDNIVLIVSLGYVERVVGNDHFQLCSSIGAHFRRIVIHLLVVYSSRLLSSATGHVFIPSDRHFLIGEKWLEVAGNVL